MSRRLSSGGVADIFLSATLRRILPNALTALNMLLGFFSVVCTFHEKHLCAAWLIIVALFVDGLDGKTARWLNGFSEFGKEFDSLSDAISFGVAPAILSYAVLHRAGMNPYLASSSTSLFLLAGVLRLVRFSIFSVPGKDKGEYTGLPIPAAAGYLASFIVFSNAVFGRFAHEYFLLAALVMLPVLMLSGLPYKGILEAFGMNSSKPLRIKARYMGLFLAMSAFAPYTYYPYCTAYITTGFVRYVHRRKIRTRTTFRGSGC